MKSAHAFLIRCWSDQPDLANQGHVPARWQFLVMEIGDARHGQRGFSDLAQVTGFLSEKLLQGQDAGGSPGPMVNPDARAL